MMRMSSFAMATKKKRKAKPKVSNTQWVYVLSNASMPGLIKIGMTTTSPQQRNTELGSATGVPTPFKIEYCVKVANALQVEKTIHRQLAAHRVNRRREFFEMDVKTAIKAVNAVALRRYSDRSLLLRVLRYGMQAVSAIALIYMADLIWNFSSSELMRSFLVLAHLR